MARRSAARHGPQTVAYAPGGPEAAPGEAYAPADPWNVPADPGGGGPAGKKSRKAADKARGGGHWAGSGGRWWVWIGRVVLWAAILVVLVNGIRAPFERASDDGGGTAPSAAKGGDSKPKFPETAASAYALQFASVYLNYDEDKTASGLRAQQLEQFLPSGESGQFGWNGDGKMTLESAQVAGVAAQDANSGIVTVLARANSKWLQLAVPVYVKDGAMVISGRPAILPPPVKAQPPSPGDIDSDTVVAKDLEETLTGFFKAYGSGETSDLARYADGNIVSLAGSVTFGQLRQVVVPKSDANPRKATATVIWQVPSGVSKVPAGELEQAYEVTVVKKDGKWWVREIHGSTQPTTGS